ncbi:MAG: GntR family transcriptional regulator [Rhizobacter sp.]|nr:GntR family transcriptional regulator [Rhizobacter sp.]
MATTDPLYKTVKQQLTEALRQGKWKHGQKIASEPQLAERYGASVGTVRKAIGELVAENILVREQGRGTFVASHTPDYMLNVFFRIVDLEGHKELPTISRISMKRSRADKLTATQLHLRPRAPVIELETLLTLHGRPTILDRMRLPGHLFQDISELAFTRRDGTVYGLFQERFGITVVRTEEFITAVSADERTAELLGVPTGAPLLRIVRTAYTYKDVPVDTRVRLVDSTHHGYLSVLGNA